ncbi:MAG: 1,2-phenylacetyl-CoA epoxidase subunit PaaE [Bacteroidota bacterium]|nr:1,2-phenylacetyl-CoA epoxidase subunit PaaE [Bacteroidota bacterium]MDP4244640.1 1,2-phenylacetyl-CoA epoxidase subunit PaaE [Bacteroidota bacterium]MDP4254625.1 1,2-phenylacetyl-CoA epoxidase subunit PaaE [Bacteroidota bacterium]MDP4258664.1 1,2-phenylacetyl-CoA epoxidase subunit PaaE [Bacteroidota bacterium]
MKHFRKLQVSDVRRETPECVSIAFAIPPEWEEEFLFRQGQNITIRTRIGDEEIRRSYSICSSPLDNELRIAVKQVPKGRFSGFANERLTKGQELDVLPPTGRFYTELNPAQAKNYLAFAAGSGITPVLSLIKTTLATEPGSQFTLVYGNRHRASIIFREQLEALKDRYMDRFILHHVLSRETADTPVNQGRIDPEKCAQLCEKLIDLSSMDEVFLCGPEKMIFSVKEWLEQQGIDKKKIHFELFNTLAGRPAETVAASPPGKPGGTANPPEAGRSGATGKPAGRAKVSIRLDGVSFDFDLDYDGEPILDAALRQGADLPFACKGGVCCTCRARLVEGKVDMEVNYALEEEELARGFILTCQSHPRTEKVVIDFDAR